MTKLLVYLPDVLLRLDGQFVGPARAGGQPTLLVGLGRDHHEIQADWNAGGLVSLTPLALVVDAETSTVLFNVRGALGGLDQPTLDWLRDNPSWPDEVAQEL